MDAQQTLRLLIQRKLDEGRLPHNSIPRLWGGPSNGELCDACDEPIAKYELLMEGIAIDHGRAPIRLDVQCFFLWDALRVVPGRQQLTVAGPRSTRPNPLSAPQDRI